jgi:hypothetical protein
MNLNLFCFAFAILLSCSREVEIKKDNSGRYLINSQDLEVKMAKPLAWANGRAKAFDISSGFQVVLAIPEIGEKNILQIAEEKKVDSWVIQISRLASGTKEVLGAFSVPLFNQKTSFKSAGKAGSRLVLEINYTASYMTSNAGPDDCPMLGHNKKIDSLEIETQAQNNSTFSVASFDPQKYNGIIEPEKMSANRLNGSKTLLGDYIFEIAFFQSSTKIVVSNFLTYPQKVSVKGEKSYMLKDCKTGSGKPSQPGMKDFIKDFKFGH